MKQNNYLKNRSWEEVLQEMLEALGKDCQPQNELIDVRCALHRVTGETIRAIRSSPHYPAAAMDGYAVRAEDTYGINERQPKWLVLNKQAVQIDTGDPLPERMNAVIIWEKVMAKEEDKILIGEPIVPWANVRAVGEDIIEGEVLLPINHQIRPQDIGSLLAGGVLKINVRKKPLVGILPTGDEIRPPEYPVQRGEIVDSNSAVLVSLVEEWGGTSKVWPITPDKIEEIEEKLIQMAATQDILVVIAGSSAGRDDYTARIIAKYGRIFAHGVAIKPGKPVVLGEIKGKPVIGIPGYPVSAYISAQLFLKNLVRHLLGMPQETIPELKAILNKKIFSALGSEEFVRVKLGKVKDKWIAAPISRGAGVTTSLVKADGILRVPRLQEGFHEGQTVDVQLLKPMDEIEKTLVCIGSHDLVLDIINSHLKANNFGAVSSAHVGSMAGIMALRKEEAHFSGVHLLDPETGEYNISYIKKYLAGKKITLVNLVYRTQGFLVKKGNPLKIRGLKDLIRQDITFINRQPGSGTRVLLDYLLAKQAISPVQIKGYEREEYTHLGVAIAVASGMADVGLGIQSAAEALGLDFIPVGEERYDLAIPTEYLKDPLLEKMLSIIRSESFHKEVLSLGGYDTRDTGKIIAEIQ